MNAYEKGLLRQSVTLGALAVGVAVAGATVLFWSESTGHALGSGAAERARRKAGLGSLKAYGIDPRSVFPSPGVAGFESWPAMFESLPKPASEYLTPGLGPPRPEYRWWALVQALTAFQEKLGAEQGAQALRAILTVSG